jgi:hypothetical protein
MNRRQITAGAGLGLGVLLAAPAAAQADDFRVTNLADGVDEGPPGSLRRAITDANGTAGADRVLFKSKLSGTIELDGGLSIYGSDVEIIGPGARKLTVKDGGNSIFVPYTGAFSPVAIDVAISGLSLTGNNVGNDNGGAISSYADDGSVDLTLSKVTISHNTAGGEGGGVSMRGVDGGTLVVEDSTIAGNTAGDDGGGLFGLGVEASIRNSTISGNSAGDDGGGAWISGGPLEVLNSTVTRNQADDETGGVHEANIPESDVRGTILAGNTASVFPDLSNGPWLASFSLIEDREAVIFNKAGTNNLFDVDPKLKPLKNNGGPTDTHAFKKSPAKNKGPSDAPNSDQRGAPRKGKPDIGAYEFTKCEGVIVNRVGTPGKDKLKGTKRKDGMLGLGGNDKLSGKKGRDGLCGGQGKDKLKGGPGKDKLNGGLGKDKEVQ